MVMRRVTARPVPGQPSATLRQQLMSMVLFAVVGLGLLIGLYRFTIWGGEDLPGPDSVPGPSFVHSADTAWPPDGFTPDAANPSIAWRWMDQPDDRCPFADGPCAMVLVVARQGCRTSVTAVAAVLDANGKEVDVVSRSSDSLAPGEFRRITLDLRYTAGTKAGNPALDCR